ncbi:MAG: hypothetical protein JWL70_2388 [Acidimicrobiia bacterium]|nr:hypothetical protein [Acidimicrobiia bacterium]
MSALMACAHWRDGQLGEWSPLSFVVRFATVSWLLTVVRRRASTTVDGVKGPRGGVRTRSAAEARNGP